MKRLVSIPTTRMNKQTAKVSKTSAVWIANEVDYYDV